MAHVALTAVGTDRPGIVAAITGVLVELGCNLEDSSMSILRGQFAVLLVIDAPASLDAAAVEGALARVAADFDLVVAARPLPGHGDGTPPTDPAAGVAGEPAPEPAPEPEPEPAGAVYTFSVHGADRPGIVHRATSALADSGGNVVDLSTRLVGDPGQPAYVMMITAGFPPGVDAAAAAGAVTAAVEAFGVRCHAHATDVDVF